MAIQQNFPDEGPTLNLNFAGSRTLDPRITFTRTSSATFVGPDGLIKIAPVNSPRFDHSYNPTTGEIESLGLLIEEQRQNLLLRSEEIDNASWGKVGCGIVTNTSLVISPDGKNTADKLVEDTSNSVHYIFQGVTSLANTRYSVSFFAKSAERSKIRIAFAGAYYSSGSASMDFDLTTGISTVVGGSQGSAEASITPYPNGWYRCTASSTLTNATSSQLPQILLLDNSNSQDYQGDGTSGIYVWGSQLEVGAFPTSYIPTTASTATRTADTASMTGANFSRWFNPSESTFFASFRPGYNASATVPGRTPHVLQAGNATTVNDNYTIRGAESNPYWTVLIRSASPSSLQFPGFNPYPYLNSSTQYKSALSVNSSLISVSLNGLLNADSANTTTVNHTTQFNKLFIGSGTGGGPPYELAGTISQLTYYPKRLPNNILRNLTR
jgi:hypothetical protein